MQHPQISSYQIYQNPQAYILKKYHPQLLPHLQTFFSGESTEHIFGFWEEENIQRLECRLDGCIEERQKSYHCSGLCTCVWFGVCSIKNTAIKFIPMLLTS